MQSRKLKMNAHFFSFYLMKSLIILFCISSLADISNERLNFQRQSYEAEKSKILQTYEQDMNDYKTKKFRMQKELESVYYGLAERSLKMTKTAEEEFLQKSDELKNSVRASLCCCSNHHTFAIPIRAVETRNFSETIDKSLGKETFVNVRRHLIFHDAKALIDRVEIEVSQLPVDIARQHLSHLSFVREAFVIHLSKSRARASQI